MPFSDFEIEYEGRICRFEAAEGALFDRPSLYWHPSGVPSTWLAVEVFLEARRRLGDAPDSVVLKLAAGFLGITADELRASISWHEQYMRWHDGDQEYRVLESGK